MVMTTTGERKKKFGSRKEEVLNVAVTESMENTVGLYARIQMPKRYFAEPSVSNADIGEEDGRLQGRGRDGDCVA